MSVLDLATPRWAIPLLAPARYKGVWGGRASGKSHFIAEYLIEQHIFEPNESTVCVREVQKSLDQSVKKLLEDKIQKLNAGWYFEVLDKEIRSRNGTGLFTFQGMQNHTAESIKSLEGYKRAWVEEAQTLSSYSLELLRPTIRKHGSYLLFTWNPRYKTDPVDKLLRRTKPKNSIVVNANWSDNPWLPAEMIQEMEHDFATDPDRAEHIWNGAYGNIAGSILGKWVQKARREGRIGEVMYDPKGAPLVISCDIGFHDTASFWYWQPTIGGYHLPFYEGESGLDADDWIERIKDNVKIMRAKLGKIWLPHDAKAKTFQSKHTTMERFIKAFGADKVGVVPMTRKLDQINAARRVIDHCAFDDDGCGPGIDGLEGWAFKWIPESGAFSKDPIHDSNSHPADGFAYGAIVMEMEKPQVTADTAKFDVKGLTDGKIRTGKTLDQLWRETERANKPKRI